MKIACFSFTDKGRDLGEKLKELKNDIYEIYHYNNSQVEGGIKKLLKSIWNDYHGFIFISATGIAIRLIHPFIEHKSKDPAIIVIDDLGRYVISLLSGHIGGANEMALFLAKEINGEPIITTASDSRGIDSIDMFAKNNDYFMEDMNTITQITSMMVNGKKIGFYSEEAKEINYPNLVRIQSLNHVDESIEGLIIVSSSLLPNLNIPHTVLRPKSINIGIGCKKGVESDRIIKAIEELFRDNQLSLNSIKNIGTIEVKKEEKGIIEACKYFQRPLKIFLIEEIKRVEGIFEKSQFVKETIGVYSVSEPVAYLLGGELVVKKSKHNGITISISKENLNG